MKTIAIISQKGGCGKTTLATHLAVFATQKGQAVVLVDLDKQRSASNWYKQRSVESELAQVASTAGQLPQILKKSQEGGADIVIIDTAPYADKDATIAARVADYVLVPCRPEFFDMVAMPSTVQLLKLTETPFCIVLNGCPPGNTTQEARETLRQQGFPVSDLSISHRQGIKHSSRAGEILSEFDPQNTAVGEIAAIYEFLKEQVE